MGLFCIILSILLFIIFFHPMLAGVVNAGNVFGVFFSVLLFLYGLFRKYIPQGTRCFVLTLITFGCVFMIFMGALMVRGTKGEEKAGCTVVVLGCGLNGERPSLILSKRIRAAYDYLIKNPGSACICSGGQGKDEVISEAECIYRELLSLGIAEDRLYKEEESTSTRENLRNSLTIIQEHSLNPALAVATSDFHCFRAVRLAEKEGAEAIPLSAPTMLSFLPTYFVRECFSILKMWLVP